MYGLFHEVGFFQVFGALAGGNVGRGAALGTEIEVPMVDGTKEKFRIPEGTQTGTKFTIKNKGFKSINGKWRGDFVFTVVVQVPKRLTHEQRELLVELAKTMNEQPPLKRKGIFG